MSRPLPLLLSLLGGLLVAGACTFPDVTIAEPPPAAACALPEDCTGADVCHLASCELGRCGYGDRCPAGKLCDDAGDCVECLGPDDCAETQDCRMGLCEAMAAPHCMNGSQDEDETDVNCGGSACPPCGIDQGCVDGGDCLSGICDETRLVCLACTSDADCAGFPETYCDMGLSDVCVPLKGLASACSRDGECQSNSCPVDDSICCDQACGESCTACLQAKSGGPNGECHPITSCEDPDNECADVAGLSVCGPEGTCRLALGCVPP
jgi:hypothetical protein